MNVVNLNKACKAKSKAKDKATADANAVRFGRTKAERVFEAVRADLASARLSQLKFEDE